jgi:hypothetical protein
MRSGAGSHRGPRSGGAELDERVGESAQLDVVLEVDEGRQLGTHELGRALGVQRGGEPGEDRIGEFWSQGAAPSPSS